MLTQEQLVVLGASGPSGPVSVFDPIHQRSDVLVPTETYEKLMALDETSQSNEPLYALMNEVAGREGWDDPEMDVYDKLDPRKAQ